MRSAGSDAGRWALQLRRCMDAYMHEAIDQAWRAVNELQRAEVIAQ